MQPRRTEDEVIEQPRSDDDYIFDGAKELEENFDGDLDPSEVDVDDENPLDLLTPEAPVEEAPLRAKPKAISTKAALSGGGEVKVSIKPPAPVPVAVEQSHIPQPKKARNALDLFTEGDFDYVRIERISGPGGKRSYRGKSVQCAECGRLPALGDLAEEIKTRWGGGTYKVYGRDSSGRQVSPTIRIAGKPLPIDEEAAREEEEGEQDLFSQDWNDPATGGPRSYDFHRPPPGATQSPYGFYNPSYTRPEAEDERRELRDKVSSMENEFRSRERDLVNSSQQKSDSFMGEFMKMIVMQHAQEQSRWEREFRENQDRQAREGKQREEQNRSEREQRELEFKQRQLLWEREQKERQLERERQEGERKGESQRDGDRMREERIRYEQQRKDEVERYERARKDDKSIQEQRMREVTASYERMQKMQEGISQNSGKWIDTMKNFLNVAHQARDMVAGEPDDPKVAQIKAVQEMISTGLSAAQPVVSALRGKVEEAAAAANAQPAVDPNQQMAVMVGPNGEQMLVPLQAALPVSDSQVATQELLNTPQKHSQPPAAPGVEFPPVDTTAGGDGNTTRVVNPALVKLTELLGRLTQSIKGQDGQADPPEWSVGRLQDSPEVLAQLRSVATPEELVMQLEVLGTQEIPDSIRIALAEFVAVAQTAQGKSWIGDLLARLAPTRV